MNMKTTLGMAIAAAAIMMASCQSQREKDNSEDRSQQKIDSLERVIAQSNSETEDLARTIQDIRDGFRKINEAEGRVTTEQAETPDQQVIQENMDFIQQTLRLNRQRIAELQQMLRNANQTNTETKKAYEAMVEEFNHQIEAKTEEIARLRQQLEEQNIRIAEQDEAIDRLHEDVEDLTQKNAEKERTVAEQDAAIHTAWYVFGTKKELREQHIMDRDNVMSSDQANKDYFTKIDIRVTKKIPLYAIPQSLVEDRYFFDPKNPDDPRTNINSRNPRLVNLTSSQSSATSSLHLCKGDYLKLKNVTLGYTLPESLTSKISISKIRVYATGENLFAITEFPGLDPEMHARR